MTLTFLQAVIPPMLEFARELFVLFRGDHVQAVKHIEDRRAEVAALRAANNAALEKKYPGP